MRAVAGLLVLLLAACEGEPVVGALGRWSVAFSGTHVSFAGTSPQAVAPGGRLSIQVTPDPAYTLSKTVGGTCAVGVWNGDIYTTGPVRSNCSVSFSAVPKGLPESPPTISVQAGAHGTVAPAGATTVERGESQLFTAAADSHYHVDQWLLDGVVAQTGGQTFTLSNVTANHTLAVTFVIDRFTVTPSSGANGNLSPSAPQAVDYGGSVAFTATPSSGYGVLEWQVDGVMVQTGGTAYALTNITANHAVSVSFASTTLATSVSALALSVDDSGTNAALTGNPRVIAVTNTGAIAATNLSVNANGLPTGTSLGANSCGSTLAAGASCSVALVPGAVASPDGSSTPCTSGTAPVAGTVTFSANNGNSVQVNVYVLGYGCQYQGGFVFAVDDATPNTGSIGGKVVSLIDQAAPFLNSGAQGSGIIWTSNGVGATQSDYSADVVPFISELSTTGAPDPTYGDALSHYNSTYTNTVSFPLPTAGAFTPCHGATDGACNTSNLITYYDAFQTGHGVGGFPYSLSAGPTSHAFYAAGLCTQTIAGRSDWYLPAICELDAVSPSITCPASTQSMIATLPFLVGDWTVATPATSCSPPSGTQCLAGIYWSSSQEAAFAFNGVWVERFHTNSDQDPLGKNNRLGVRCARALIP